MHYLVFNKGRFCIGTNSVDTPNQCIMGFLQYSICIIAISTVVGVGLEKKGNDLVTTQREGECTGYERGYILNAPRAYQGLRMERVRDVSNGAGIQIWQ